MKRLWTSSLVTRVFLSYLAVIVLLFACFYIYSSAELRKLQIAAISERIGQQARFLARILPVGEEGPTLDALCRQLGNDLGTRITVIAPDGKVLGDSAEPSLKIENHAGRPEVIEAMKRGSGSATRYSTTVSHEMVYHAFYQSGAGTGRIVRVAKPLTDVESAMQSIRGAILSGFFLASGFGLLLAWFFSRQLSRRFRRLEQFTDQVAQGSFPQNFFPNRTRDEISVLEQRLNDMSARIRDNLHLVIAEKEKADSILRCMIEGVLVLDPKGNVLVMNEQAKAMFHVPQGREISGLSMLEISRHPEVRRILEDVLAFDFSGSRYSKQVELDDERWFRVNAVRLRSPQGQFLGSILVFHDVTDIRRFESMRSDFVANVSHELRTPLTAIRGYVETLLETPPSDPEDSRQFLQIIDRHSERLSRLTEDLLTLSDLESGNIQLALQPLDPNHLIQRVLEIFWDRAAKREVHLTHRVVGNVPKLQGDLDRLQQLFINLVDNALKYTPAGGTVTLTATQSAVTNGSPPQVEIAVSDTGPGIPEKDLPRLTERFYRVDKARSRDLGGTGLGLAIVKHIVQAHKGELKIESEINKGTTVRVRIPQAQSKGSDRKTILFLCSGNSCRSQMAEGFARHFSADSQQIFSAGIDPKEMHPLAVRVMREAGIDIMQQRSKTLADVPLETVDQIITLCSEADEKCPTLGQQVQRSHWPLPDPTIAQGSEEEVLAAFRHVRDEIRSRIQELFPSKTFKSLLRSKNP
jgi:two-component system phosphate regulon sensor histidine kinase PhoR